MKTTLKALLSVSALSLLFAAAPAMAAGVDVEGENNTTGADSNNENKYEVKDESKTKLDNDADVDNKAKAKVNTGDNEQKKNTEGGGLDTGSVDASTDWETVVNEAAGMAGLSGDGLDVVGDFLNDTTGADSNNENKLEVKTKPELRLDNWADVLNKLGLKANTGDNEQSKNTTAGDMETGDVGLDAGITNEANNDSGLAGADVGSTSINVSGENNTTGADSNNENKFEVKNESNTKVDNDADLDTKVRVRANTGDNKQSKNTTGDDLVTGDVNVATDVVNSANNGTEVSSGSDMAVGADFVNDTTGADSNNENKLKVENKSKTEVKNDADVDNKLDVKANTGDNEQSKNTTAGDVLTGDVSIDFIADTEVNSN